MNWKTILATGTILLSGTFSAFAIGPVEITKLLASDGVAGDKFGYSVAVDGGTVIIGAYDHGDNSSGSAYVFRWDGGDWVEQPQITASDSSSADHFGYSVALDGDTIVIGAYGDDDLGRSSGSAYVFRWNGTTWDEDKLTASDGADFDFFGRTVAVDGDTIVIGAFGDGSDDLRPLSGSAYVFRWDGTTWVQHKLTANDGTAGDEFGRSVAAEGDTVVIGAPNDDDSRGSVYVFRWDGGDWVEHKLMAGDGVAGDKFGYSVAADGGTVIIGAYGDDDRLGSAYVFRWNGTTWGEDKLTASDGAAVAVFGHSVALDGYTAVIGASLDGPLYSEVGSAYVFRWNGTDWTEHKLTASDGADRDAFGFSVAVGGGTAVIGAPYDDDYTGSGYVYSLLSNETPADEDVVVQPAPAISLTFDSVSAAGDTSVIITENGPAPPGGFELIGIDGGKTYIEIETTATFHGFVEVCIDYSEFVLAVDPASLSLAHIVDGVWIDVTFSNDVFNGVLCGLTPSFSYFAIVQTTPFALLDDLVTAVDELAANRGIKQSLMSKLAKIQRLMEDDKTVRAVSDLVKKFIPKVQKYSGKQIPESEADDLVRHATELATVLLF